MEPRFSRFCNTLFQGGESIFPCPVSPSSWAAHPKKFFWRYLNAGIKPTATCIPEHSGYLGQFCLVRRVAAPLQKDPLRSGADRVVDLVSVVLSAAHEPTKKWHLLEANIS